MSIYLKHIDDLKSMKNALYATHFFTIAMYINDYAYKSVMFSIIDVLILMVLSCFIVSRAKSGAVAAGVVFAYLIPYGAYACTIYTMFASAAWFKEKNVKASILGPNRKSLRHRIGMAKTAHHFDKMGLI